MAKFDYFWTEIDGVCVIEPTRFGDERGGFMETYNQHEFAQAGIPNVFVQDNQSFSGKGVVRALHFQKQFPQAKLVRVLRGEVFDVAVDLRPRSATYGMWFGVTLSEHNRKQLFIPRGFAHGFSVLSDEAIFAYKCDDFYHPEDQGGVLWNDPDIGIEWRLPEGVEPILNERDRHLPTLAELKKGL
ncbi:MAG: dTDP-4-dehydrorhamnose 3,5-epimerase [Clostridia bacterium]|nr:dTDP-4-dehydrorhamnose 3,5-epimerase [Clostridia bacterium]